MISFGKQGPIWGRLSRRKRLIDCLWGSQQLISAINDLVCLYLSLDRFDISYLGQELNELLWTGTMVCFRQTDMSSGTLTFSSNWSGRISSLEVFRLAAWPATLWGILTRYSLKQNGVRAANGDTYAACILSLDWLKPNHRYRTSN